MATGAQSLPQRAPSLRRRLLLLLIALGLAVAIAVVVDRVVFADESQAARPDLQGILDGLVSTRSRATTSGAAAP